MVALAKFIKKALPRYTERERERESECVCVCVCVCSLYQQSALSVSTIYGVDFINSILYEIIEPGIGFTIMDQPLPKRCIG